MKAIISRILAAAFLMTGAAACNQQETDPQQAGTSFVELSLTSFNVLSVESKSPWQPRVQPICDIILREDHHPDVLCLQEVQHEEKQKDMIDILSAEYDHHLIGIKDVQASASLIFWKRDRFIEVDSGWTDMLQGNVNYSAGKYESHRYAHWVQLKDKSTGGEFLVYDIHLKTNGTSANYQQLRYDMISAIAPAAIARSRKAGGIPLFIVGDFNSYMTTVYNGIRSAPATCLELGFTDAATAAESSVNLKYKTSNINMETGELDWKKNNDAGYHRIDYIFSYSARKNITVNRYWTVLDFKDGSETYVKMPVPSDHTPVNAVFTLEYK